MLQFTNDYGFPDGIIHFGTWVCPYQRTTPRSPEVTVYRPGRVTLTDANAGRLVPGRPIVADISGSPWKFHMGSPVYHWQLNDGLRLFTTPGERMRVVVHAAYLTDDKAQNDLGVQKYLFAGDVGWYPPTPTSVQLGKHGGLYFLPVGMTGSTYQFRPCPLQPFAVAVHEDRDIPMVLRRGQGGTVYAAKVDNMIAYPPWGGPPTDTMLEVDGSITDFDFSPDYKKLVVAVAHETQEPHPEYADFKGAGPSGRYHRNHVKHKSSVYVFDFAWPTVKFVKQLLFPARFVSFSPDGLTAAVLGASREYWNAKEDTLTIFDIEE